MSHFLAAAAAATAFAFALAYTAAAAAATILFLGLLMTRPELLGRSSGQSQVSGVVVVVVSGAQVVGWILQNLARFCCYTLSSNLLKNLTILSWIN